VHGIVQASGGFVHVTSKPGEGSTFQVCFRACGAGLAVPQTNVAAASSKPSGETVLLVENEQDVREIAQVALQNEGYRVLTANNAEEAIELANSHPDPIDLVLTDVVMPGMSGRALADTLCETRPEMKVLFMSGFTGDMTLRHGVLQGEVNFIAKPFTFATILAKVRKVLDEPSPSQVGQAKTTPGQLVSR
jgi:DNA-binding NtrC family response regulator